MGWPVVALGEVVRHRKEFITIQPDETYSRCRVQTSARGIVLRDRVPGDAIKTKKQQVCRAGEFLVAEIDAKLGGYGLVPDELNGAIVSSHYFLFEVDEKHLLRKFLHWYCQTPNFLEQVNARGSTNYAAIRPGNVLTYTIPLPSLNEQHRIVAKLDKVAGLVGEAKATKANIRREVQALLRALVHGAPEQPHPTVPFGEVALLRPVDIEVEPDTEYQFAGVYSFGRGVFRSRVKAGSGVSYKKLICLERNDFTYPKLMAWEGALGVVPEECAGCYVSPEFPVFEINEDILHPAVVDAYFKDPLVWPSLVGTSKGTNARRRRLHPDTIRSHHIPIPPKGVQKTIRDIIERLNPYSVKKGVPELDVLIPALLNRVFNDENASFLGSDYSMRESGIGR